MLKKPNISDNPAELRRHAEARLRDQRKGQRSKAGDQKSESETLRVLHELEVHQIELEMQNAELQKARDELEVALEKYTDLYDFAPVGYLSVNESGVILEVNLTGARLLGVERSRLINRRLLLFTSPKSRPSLQTFLTKVFNENTDEECEALLLKEGDGTFWANFRAASAVPIKGTRNWCRVTFGDISARKQVEEAERRIATLSRTNVVLNQEIARRRVVEASLKKSERHSSELLAQSRVMQKQLKLLSHQILLAQEEERKRISRELHDQIAQTLTAINIDLANLLHDATHDTKNLNKKIESTQRLVQKSVEIVHRFARELRPAVLDDLGLVAALLTFMKGFSKQTGIRIHFTTFTSDRIKQLNIDQQTVFFRVAQEALNNVARHAQADSVEVNIKKLPKAIRLKIKDNGKAFDAQRAMNSKRNTRLGLIGMRERLEMVGGSFTIESAQGKGTTVCAQIPFSKNGGGGGNQ